MDAIHAFAREGEVDNLLKCIESGVTVNLKGLFSHLSPFLFPPSLIIIIIFFVLHVRPHN